MANNFAAFFETLVAGADEYNKAKVGRTALLDAVYKDVKPEAARIGKTVDVYFPDVGPLQAINNGILTGTSVNPNYIPLVFQTRAGAALQFQDFEQWQTAVDLAQKFFDPLYKRAREYLNGQIAALITPANFNCQRPDHRRDAGRGRRWPTSSTPGACWPTRRCRSRTRDKLRLMVHNQVYRKMLGDSAWVQESLVCGRDRLRGAPAGRRGPRLQLPGRLGPADADRRRASILYGQVTVTYGSTTVTGLNTVFTQQLIAGTSYLTFGCDGQTQDPVQGRLDPERHLHHAQFGDLIGHPGQRQRDHDRPADHQPAGTVDASSSTTPSPAADTLFTDPGSRSASGSTILPLPRDHVSLRYQIASISQQHVGHRRHARRRTAISQRRP